eukprot:3470630-Rhodomonas_salina.1
MRLFARNATPRAASWYSRNVRRPPATHEAHARSAAVSILRAPLRPPRVTAMRRLVARSVACCHSEHTVCSREPLLSRWTSASKTSSALPPSIRASSSLLPCSPAPAVRLLSCAAAPAGRVAPCAASVP